MTAPVDIVNRALQAIGAQATVGSINPSDGSQEGNAASLLYTSRIQSLMRAAHWNFARKQILLTQLKASIINGVVSTNPPPIPWMYEYAYPADCLAARFLVPYFNSIDGLPAVPFTTGMVAIPQWSITESVPFVVGTDFDSTGENSIRCILTNYPQATLVYTADFSQIPDLWDPHFAIAAESYLSCWLVQSLARNRDLWKDQITLVQEIVAKARVSDGNEGVTKMDHLPDWMRVRGALGAKGWYADNIFYAGYDSLSFPEGSAF